MSIILKWRFGVEALGRFWLLHGWLECRVMTDFSWCLLGLLWSFADLHAIMIMITDMPSCACACMESLPESPTVLGLSGPFARQKAGKSSTYHSRTYAHVWYLVEPQSAWCVPRDGQFHIRLPIGQQSWFQLGLLLVNNFLNVGSWIHWSSAFAALHFPFPCP